MEVKVERFEPITVASVRHVGPYDQCEAAWMKLMAHPEIQKRMGPDMTCIGICYDDPDITGSDKIRMDACIAVDDGFTPENGVEKQEVKGGEYAVVIHKGPYSGLHDAYRRFFGTWLPESGREAEASPSLEIYRNSPQDTPESELLTEIRIPLK